MLDVEKIVHKQDIVEYPGFLTAQESQALIDYYESASEEWMETCFYNARVMNPFAPFEKNPSGDINDHYFYSLRTRLQEYGEAAMARKLRNLTLSAHKWLPGAFASDHADNAELDGTLNAWQDNKMVTIIYLNDNYEGGELTFRDHGISIAPKQGTMVAFDVGFENIHGVNEVLSGQRWTMLASWDWADSVYPPGFLEDLQRQREEMQPEQDAQRDEWKKGNII
jgi:hypothetical protein